MTLNEKFKQIDIKLSKNHTTKIVEAEAEIMKKIAEEFAIGFLQFTEGTYSFGNIMGKWYLHADTSKEYTTKELLEIYKEEKES